MKNTVLIVDDDEFSQRMLENIIVNLGYPTAVCEDGNEAMQHMVDHHASVVAIFLDIYMPEIDGISTLGHLRNHYPEIPVVMVTSSTDDDDKKLAAAWGAAAYIQKPFIAESIAALLRVCVAA